MVAAATATATAAAAAAAALVDAVAAVGLFHKVGPSMLSRRSFQLACMYRLNPVTATGSLLTRLRCDWP